MRGELRLTEGTPARSATALLCGVLGLPAPFFRADSKALCIGTTGAQAGSSGGAVRSSQMQAGPELPESTRQPLKLGAQRLPRIFTPVLASGKSILRGDADLGQGEPLTRLTTARCLCHPPPAPDQKPGKAPRVLGPKRRVPRSNLS